MTLDTEERMETTAPAESAAKPPPVPKQGRGAHLFQTMAQLRARHGQAMCPKGRAMHVAVALLGGAMLFAALYAVILFLE